MATGPNQVWSWDITKLRGPEKWHYYCLYVVLDIFSRYVVGWLVAERETVALAQTLQAHTLKAYHLPPGQLTAHADRGTAALSWGQAEVVLQRRTQVLAAAYQAHPERFVHKRPKPASAPSAVWINRPESAAQKAKLFP